MVEFDDKEKLFNLKGIAVSIPFTKLTKNMNLQSVYVYRSLVNL
mgnify:CR=1 FL=1